MAEEKQSKKNNKGAIIGGCIAAAIVIIAIVIVCVVMLNKNSYNDAYFVSDGSKYVITYDQDELDLDESSEYVPLKSHLVYYYSGDKITDMKAFYEFADENTAKSAFELYKEAGDGNFKEISLSGKYVIITANDSEYADYTASDIKSQIEFNETFKNSKDGPEVEDVEVEEDEDPIEEPVEESTNEAKQ